MDDLGNSWCTLMAKHDKIKKVFLKAWCRKESSVFLYKLKLLKDQSPITRGGGCAPDLLTQTGGLLGS